MNLYYVKVDLYGLKSGQVERFGEHKAGQLMLAGQIEPFDAKNGKHAAALKQQEKEADGRRQVAEAELLLERENPVVWREQLLTRRREHEKAQAARMGALRKRLALQRAAAEQ